MARSVMSRRDRTRSDSDHGRDDDGPTCPAAPDADDEQRHAGHTR